MCFRARRTTLRQEYLPNLCRQTVSPPATRIRKFTKKEEPFLLMSRGNSSISQCNTGPIGFMPLHMKSVAGNGLLPLVHTLRAAGLVLTAFESSESTKWKRWLPPPIHTRQLVVPHPASNSHAPPTLPKKCFLGEHMERRRGGGGGGRLT